MNGVQNLGFDSSEQNGQTVTQRRSKGDNGEQVIMTDYVGVEPPREPANNSENKLWQVSKIVIVNVAVVTYFVFATLEYIKSRDECEEDCGLAFCSPYGMLLFVLGATYVGCIYFLIVKRYFGKFLKRSLVYPVSSAAKKLFSTIWAKIAAVVLVLAGIAVYLAFETYEDLSRLKPLIGIFSIIVIGFVFSSNPKKIKWRPVIAGVIFQFLLGVFTIRWSVGRAIFECFGDKVAAFLNYSKEGASFVFSEFLVIDKNVFAFAALPTIFFFSLIISVLYYLGTMQWVLFKLGWILQSILGTTVCESVIAAGNIFLGMSESPLLIRPYIAVLTESEIHAIMVSGFATVSGTVLAAYISFGAEATHLITASVMAAPAALFFAKLILPETEESKTSSGNIQMEKSSDSSLLDAASNGASQGISLILNIIANLVAFVAFVAFADGMIKWVTFLVGFDDVGIQFILGKIFIPVSWALGVDWEDCEAVGNIIGTKTIINEFVAFQLLGEYKKAGEISLRSSAIATYAICGFANPSSMGIMIGALSSIAPNRRSSITKVAFRAFVSGCLVSMVTASIAGLLMTDEMIEGTAPKSLNFTMSLSNTTAFL